ncbi:MAG TPA: helix-turn-helix domain-containing protein [Chitinophagaceae bacterium]|nr:helix-turn-helix domain-containing protein [Chitinophagaceae bacterium]
MTVYNIKNMVCARCIKTVSGIFQSAGAIVKSARLGIIELAGPLSATQETKVREQLTVDGFEMLDDQRVKVIEQIKTEIINLVHYGELDEMRDNLSDFIVNRIHKDYNYLSNLFSSVTGTTIEHYFILQKIEKVKELLVYDELSLSQISFQLGYSSVSHLSAQFKKITGLTPSQFKKLTDHHRRHLDSL